MINADTYQELYIIFKYMKKEDVMKIPVDILENIRQKRNSKYKTKIKTDDLLNRDNLLPQTLELLAWFDINYWRNKEDKEKIVKFFEKKQELFKILDIKNTLTAYGTDLFSND